MRDTTEEQKAEPPITFLTKVMVEITGKQCYTKNHTVCHSKMLHQNIHYIINVNMK